MLLCQLLMSDIDIYFFFSKCCQVSPLDIVCNCAPVCMYPPLHWALTLFVSRVAPQKKLSTLSHDTWLWYLSEDKYSQPLYILLWTPQKYFNRLKLQELNSTSRQSLKVSTPLWKASWVPKTMSWTRSKVIRNFAILGQNVSNQLLYEVYTHSSYNLSTLIAQFGWSSKRAELYFGKPYNNCFTQAREARIRDHHLRNFLS
jgi:hypothetical protein